MSELTMQELSGKPAPTVIRAAVAERCKSLGLTGEERLACENEALDLYWRTAASNARCCEAGYSLAERISRGETSND
jgi:hypothetical protein